MLDEIEICHNKIAQAVWALDRHMWTMLCEYLPTESIREQLQGMQTGAWIQEHGKKVQYG